MSGSALLLSLWRIQRTIDAVYGGPFPVANRRTGFLFGAGASVEAGYPTSTGLTQLIHKQLAGHEKHAMGLALAGLLFDNAVKFGDPYLPVDIEKVVASLQLLGSRTVLEVAPLIESWHPAVQALEQEASQRHHYPDTFNLEFDLKLAFDSSGRRFGGDHGPDFHRAAQAIAKYTSRRPKGAVSPIFQETIDAILENLVAILRPQGHKSLRYLDPLKSFISPGRALPIFTLNYDLVAETWAAASGLTVSRGLTGPTESIEFDQRADIHLFKLHGSIDWRRPSTSQFDGNVPFVIPSEELTSSRKPIDPLVVFGQGNKLTTEGPFLDLLINFRNRLDTLSGLVIVGYSFRDKHINDVLLKWLKARERARVMIIDSNGFQLSAVSDKRLSSALEEACAGRVFTDGACAGLAKLSDGRVPAPPQSLAKEAGKRVRPTALRGEKRFVSPRPLFPVSTLSHIRRS